MKNGFAQEASQLNEKIIELENKKKKVKDESWISSRLRALGAFIVDNIIEPIVDWFEDLLRRD